MYYEAKDALESNLLQQAFGKEVILSEDGEDGSAYKVLQEFRLGEQIYAVLHSPKLSKNEEYVIFRVVRNALSVVTLETIDDDEEWEAVAEVYDELTFEI